MVTFLPEVHGVNLSEALAEQAVHANTDSVVLYTYELYHPLGTPDGPIRVVKDNAPLLASLEGTAPRNPYEEVEFMASSVDVSRPTETTAVQAELKIRQDHVNSFIEEAVARARGSFELWEIIERVYVTSDLSEPHILPVFKATVIDVEKVGPAAIFTVIHAESIDTAIPAITFKPEEYPGLTSR